MCDQIVFGRAFLARAFHITVLHTQTHIPCFTLHFGRTRFFALGSGSSTGSGGGTGMKTGGGGGGGGGGGAITSNVGSTFLICASSARILASKECLSSLLTDFWKWISCAFFRSVCSRKTILVYVRTLYKHNQLPHHSSPTRIGFGCCELFA